MLLYLEADDEITTVIRRLRESDGESVILVAPGRAKALTSSVSLRLLASIAADEGRAVALVADATTRSLGSEAGIATYASVADAEQGVAATIVPPTRAQIHVVQGGEPTAHDAAQAAPAPRRNERLDDTRAVPIATTPVTPVRKRARRVPWLAVAGALALLLVAGVAGAVVAPAATIHLAPQAEVVGPKTYDLTLTPDVLSGTLRAKTTGHATGKYVDRTAATGVVLFQNFNTYPVDVPAGAQVAAGSIVFDGQDIGEIKAKDFALRPERAKIQMVFQDPTDSLNPRFTAARSIADPLYRLGGLRGGAGRGRSVRSVVGPWVGSGGGVFSELPDHTVSGTSGGPPTG